MNPVSALNHKIFLHSGQFNRTMGFPVEISGVSHEHAVGIAQTISAVVNSVQDPDAKSDLLKAGLNPNAALTLGDLGLMLYAQVNVTREDKSAVIVSGLTTPICPFGKQLMQLVEAGLKAAVVDYIGRVPGAIKLSAQEVTVINQWSFEEIIRRGGTNVPRYAFSFHPGWITECGIQKLKQTCHALQSASRLSDTARAVLSTYQLNTEVAEAIHVERRRITIAAAPDSEAYLREMDRLAQLAGAVREKLKHRFRGSGAIFTDRPVAA